MTDSPADATPYEVLGVAATVDDDELRRAYRRAARETHPDLGGDPQRFRALQTAWERVGTPGARRAYDSGAARSTESAFAPSGSSVWRSDAGRSAYAPPSGRRDSRPRARSFGHPGGRSREVFLAAEREWVGLGDPIDDPYDPALVRSAPRAVRRLLGEALAEEATALIVGEMGIGVTVWHDIDAGPEGKLDHAVLAPSGLWALESIDWGGPVELERGEITGQTLLPGERPVKELVRAARVVTKQTRVRFTGRILVVPDTAIEDDVQVVGNPKKPVALIVKRRSLAIVLNGGYGPDRGAVDVFEIRARLQETVRFV